MTFGKLFLMAVLGGAGAVQLWHVHQRSVIDRELLATADGNGFVSVATAAGSAADMAVILAPLNCSSAQAKRADAMAAQLEQRGIPNTRASNYSVTVHNPELMPLLKRTEAVLDGEIPIVIINGMAKANPSVDEVVSEFRRGK